MKFNLGSNKVGKTNGISMHFKVLKSMLIENSQNPKRHISDALDDALVQRIIEELKSNPAISQKEWKSSWILVDKKPIG